MVTEKVRVTKPSWMLPANLVALIGSVAAIGVLFAPWMGVKFPLGDVASGRPVYWGNAFQDQNAFEMSLLLSLVIAAIGVVVAIVSVAGVTGRTVGRDRVVGWALIGLGLMVAASSYLLVYAVTSSPFKGGAPTGGFFHWGPLIGPKLAVLCAVVISGAGIVNVWLAKRPSQIV